MADVEPPIETPTEDVEMDGAEETAAPEAETGLENIEVDESEEPRVTFLE
jgi:hypothetical protein